MEKEPYEQRRVTVTLKNGLHMRPFQQITQLTATFPGEVSIRREDNYTVNGKSMFDLLTLQAEFGTPLVLEARGDGAEELLDSLESMFESNFGEPDEFADPPSKTAIELQKPTP